MILLYAPPYNIVSALSMPLRASTKPGLHFCNFIPCNTSLYATILPPGLEASVIEGLIPSFAIISHNIVQSILHQTSPTVCGAGCRIDQLVMRLLLARLSYVQG